MSKRTLNKFKDLKWNDLEDSFGSTILGRGENYFNSSLVKNVRTVDGKILAIVRGTRKYSTVVNYKTKPRKRLVTNCTCPYGGNCKHGVATILTYLDYIKNNHEILETTKDDPDYLDATGKLESSSKSSYDDGITLDDLKEYLLKKSKDELADIVISKIVKDRYELDSYAQKVLIEKGIDSTKLVNKAISMIRSGMSEPAWTDGWTREGYTPDFSGVREIMDILLEAKKYDEVVKIFDEFLDTGNDYVSTSNDEGETCEEISLAADIGFEALEKSSLSNVDKIYKTINVLYDDEFSMFEAGKDLLKNIKDKKAWNEIADKLDGDLWEMPEERTYSYKYQRGQLVDYLVLALEKADRSDEITKILKEEAEQSDGWIKYIDHLIKINKNDEALKACHEAMKSKGVNEYRGVKANVQERIVELSKKSKDFDSVLLIKQEQFLEHPSLESFTELKKASKKTKNEELIRKWAVTYLNTGKAKKQGALKKAYQADNKDGRFPKINVLIDIAEKEKRIDDIYKLYKKVKDQKGYYLNLDQISRNIKKKYPEVAIEIWKKKAESLIAETKPRSYHEAIPYLKQVKSKYKELMKPEKWDGYISKLREVNKRKTSFIKALRKIDNVKII